MDENVQVAARRVAHSGLAFAGHADARSFIDSGGDFHRQAAALERAAFAGAGLARIGDGFAAAAAGRAAALDDEETLLGADLAGAAAGPAGLRLAAPAGAAAGARLAFRQRLDGDGGVRDCEGFLERQLEVVSAY